ncbi:MAG TPA: hypothetical protein VMA53_03995 [Stellaceae bacterium]|nr:hypothetical protein [Stellaceae bacterium]
MRSIFFATATLSLLAACAVPQGTSQSTGASAIGSPVAELRTSLAQFTLADLQNASTDAKAHGDKLAAMCYDFLAAQVAAQTSTPGSNITGAVSAFQRLRDFQSVLAGGISQDFQLNCAPLLSDEQANLAKLGFVTAGTIASSGALP